MKKFALKYYGDMTNVSLALDKCKTMQCMGITTKETEWWGKERYGCKVYSPFDIAAMYEKKEIDYIVFPYGIELNLLKNMVGEFLTLKVKEEHIFIAVPEFLENPCEENLCAYENYDYLPYIEFHVTDNCNLNCKGCSHFSPLVEGEKFADFMRVKKDFMRLKEIVKYIGTIRILGGEPLLNKQLNEYCFLVRELYPYAEISIVTNGLLIKSMSEKLIAAIKKNTISITFSIYPPLFSKANELINYVRKLGIKVKYSLLVTEFSYYFYLGGGLNSGKTMISCGCPNLCNGFVVTCPIIAYGGYFNKKFGAHIDTMDGRIDIYDSKMTYPRLMEELKKVRKSCDICMINMGELNVKKKQWEVGTGSAAMEDWVWEEKE